MTDSGPQRLQTYTAKIDGDRTGMRGSVFLHVDHDLRGNLYGVRLSEKGKDGSTLDLLLHAIGDEATRAVRQLTALRVVP